MPIRLTRLKDFRLGSAELKSPSRNMLYWVIHSADTFRNNNIIYTHTHTHHVHTHVANKILVGLCGQSPFPFPSHRTNKTLEQLSAPKRLPHLIDTNFASCFALLSLPLPHTPHIFSDCSLIVCKHWHVLWQQKEYNRNEKKNANKYEKKIGRNPKKLLAKLDCHKNWQAEEIWRIVALKKLKEVNQWKATDVVFFFLINKY